MKNIYIIFILVILFTGCSEDFLLKAPLESPSDENFLQSDAEMQVALNAAYKGLYGQIGNWGHGTIIWNGLDYGTDIALMRPNNAKYIFPWTINAQESQSEEIEVLWGHLYKYIERTNYIIEYMPRGKDNVSEEAYNEIMSQALFLRAFYYSYVTEFWGDVPFIEKVLIDYQDAYTFTRTPKATIVDKLLQDLDFAIANLPASWLGDDYGRITKAAAGALKARIALFNEKYDVAVSAAQDVMALNIPLAPDYQKLFEFSGIQHPENLFIVQYLAGFRQHNHPVSKNGRNSGGYSIPQPLRYLVDSYECTDGLSIDVSPLYNPDDPYSNRDPRLNATVLTDGSWFNGSIFSSYTITTKKIIDGDTTEIKNVDWTNKTSATTTGFLVRKNIDESDYANNLQGRSQLPDVVMRLPEVLLTYAEAKVELNQFDQAAYDETIKEIRERVGMPARTDIGSLTQAQKRALVRHERKVELACEGLRYFDIRRWKTIEHVMNNSRIIGRYAPAYITKIQNGEPTNFPRPTFDEWGISHYQDEENIFSPVAQHLIFDPSRGYLWPIPQVELNVVTTLDQNPGY